MISGDAGEAATSREKIPGTAPGPARISQSTPKPIFGRAGIVIAEAVWRGQSRSSTVSSPTVRTFSQEQSIGRSLTSRRATTDGNRESFQAAREERPEQAQNCSAGDANKSNMGIRTAGTLVHWSAASEPNLRLSR